MHKIHKLECINHHSVAIASFTIRNEVSERTRRHDFFPEFLVLKFLKREQEPGPVFPERTLPKGCKLLFGLISYQASIGLVSDFFAGVDGNGMRVSKRTGNMGIETRSLFCNFLPFASAVLAWRLQKMTSFRYR
jgi:hypothetical protein